MKEKLKNNLFTFIMAAILLSALLGYLTGPKEVFSPTENRYLAKRPGISAGTVPDGSFIEEFELYVKERLPFRDALIRLKALAVNLQGCNENNGIVRGRDGYLFEKLLAPGDQIYRNRAAMVDFAKEEDRDIYVCIVPNSCEILKDRLPAGFPGISQNEQIAGLYDELKENDGVHTIDMYETLTSHSDEYIYYRTDHHWTTLGAYYGYLKLCSEMELDPVDITKLEDKKKEAGGFLGTYYSKFRGTGITEDVITYYETDIDGYEAAGKTYKSLYDEDKLLTYDKYAMFMHGNEGMGVISSGNKDGAKARPELILFKDSYSNCLIPFLTYDYDRIITVDLRYFGGSVKDLLEEHDEADILLLYNFMHFNEDNHFYRLVSR